MVWNSFNVSSGFLSTSSEMGQLAGNFEAWVAQDSGSPPLHWDTMPHSESSYTAWSSTAYLYLARGVWRVGPSNLDDYHQTEYYISGAWRIGNYSSANMMLSDGSNCRVRAVISDTKYYIKLGDY